jgi:hypothetical protein
MDMATSQRLKIVAYKTIFLSDELLAKPVVTFVNHIKSWQKKELY